MEIQDRAAMAQVRDADASVLADGTVAHMDDGYRCTVRTDDGDVVGCDVLQASEGLPLRLSVGDAVLVWRAPGRTRGVVMGRIGAPDERAAGPDELLLDAGERLVLRCGDGSIEIRKDGKILIKGKDVVSHARRVNRVKGGSVSIN